MTVFGWFVLAAVCLLYVGVGMWVVAQIFPLDHTPTTYGDRSGQQGKKGTTP